MRKNLQKIIIFLFLISFFISPVFVFSQDKPLEAEYPEIFGYQPTAITTPVPEYVRYIFNFSIAICGIIAFGVLVFAGIRYLTSAGKPEEMKKAKQQIKSAFGGIIILLLSYLILITINPQLTILRLPPLVKISFAPPTPPSPPTAPEPYPDILWRIREIALVVKNMAERARVLSEEINSLTANCRCQLADSLCSCSDDYYGSCKAILCYVGPNFNPCPGIDNIKRNQEEITNLAFEIIYYKNRALAEREDLLLEVDKLDKDIAYYINKINAEKEVLEKLPEKGKPLQQTLINNLTATKEKLEKEKEYKNNLAVNLNELARLINQIVPSIMEMVDRSNECWTTGISDKCNGECDGGCHDTKGCYPKKCSGGNPCPTAELQNTLTNINKLANEIIPVCDEIVSIVENIRELQIVYPEPVPLPLPVPGEKPGSDKFNKPTIEAQWVHASDAIKGVINCLFEQDPNLGIISSISDELIVAGKKTFGQCKTCPRNCAHGCLSYHYGGTKCGGQSYAVDMVGNRRKIIEAAKKCGFFFIDEGNHVHIDTRYQHPCR